MKDKPDSITRFAVISPPRSGTHLLQAHLNSHYNIVCFGEVPKYDEIRDPILNGDFSQIEYERKETEVRGFLGHPYQITNSMLEKIKKIPSLKIIFLKRINLVRRYLSDKIAKTTNIYVSYHGEKEHVLPSIRIHKENLIKDMDETYYRFIRMKTILELVHKSINITYEDLCNDPKKTMDRVFSFLGVEKLDKLDIKIRKMENRKLNEAIENYTTLKKEFQGTEWEKFFDE